MRNGADANRNESEMERMQNGTDANVANAKRSGSETERNRKAPDTEPLVALAKIDVSLCVSVCTLISVADGNRVSIFV